MYLSNNISNEEFTQTLIDKINRKDSFSFTRFGDGEIYFINNNIPQPIQDRVKDKWGYEDMEIAKKDVISIIELALAKTDMIGLMNEQNEVSKHINYTKKKWSIKESFVRDLRDDEIFVADHAIFRSKQFGDISEFKKIIKNNNISIVSPRVDELSSNNIHELLGVSVNYVKVPMGMNLQKREEIFRKLDEIDEHVILFGCSLTGKDFGVYLANRGKIALDFGATLDAWAGLITRDWFRKDGIQNHCLIKNRKS
jgi:hypothetical protein